MSETKRVSSPLAACGAVLVVLAIVGLARGWDAELEAAARAEAPRWTPPDGGPPPDAGLSTEQIARLLAEQPMDVNRASAAELELLPRIGPTLARRVIEERDRGGPFESVEALTRVRGIGPRTVEQLAHLAVAGPVGPASTEAVTESSSPERAQ